MYGRFLKTLLSATLMLAQISAIDAQDRSRVEVMLSNGLEIFKFGMTVQEVNGLLPFSFPDLTWNKLIKNTSYNNVDVRYLGENLRLFGSLKYLWLFRREIPIFLAGPCVTEQNETVFFQFASGSLFRITLVTVDSPDCKSHKPLFEAIARFYELPTTIKQYGGIGLNIAQNNGYFKVARVEYRGPAERAGIMVGDVITSINGATDYDSSLPGLTARLRGNPGTVVKVGLYREKEQRYIETNVTRSLLDQREDFKFASERVCFFGVRSGGISIVNIIKPGFTDGSADGCRG
jgi:PDZ domain